MGHEESKRMSGNLLVLIEMVLILGGLLTFALWEIRAVRRSNKTD